MKSDSIWLRRQQTPAKAFSMLCPVSAQFGSRDWDRPTAAFGPSLCPRGAAPPLVDELAWGHLLERHPDGGAHRRLVGRGAREIGIEIDPRVRVQSHHRQV